jgi:hypothetical protein
MIAFTDGAALICVVPSRTHNGVYLVRCEPSGGDLIVSHDCPAIRFGRACRHVHEAASACERWQWWEPKKRIKLVCRRIVLKPEWDQVQLTPSPEELLRAVVMNAS